MKIWTDRTDSYLAIPPRYASHLGGLSWAPQRDALERADGSVLAFTAELLPILEGAFTRQPAPPFAFILTILNAMKRGGPGHCERLQCAFQSTHKVTARGRNVGLFIAELCRGAPAAHDASAWPKLSLALRCFRLYGDHYRRDGNEPPLSPSELEHNLQHSLAPFDDAALVHWLTHGTGPTPAGQQLARAAQTLPAQLTQLIAKARHHPRLVGATALIPAFDAALTIPPRRRSADAIPQGGYCDVAIKGDFAQLLPTQLTFETDEFVRRFAAGELLYFTREEPSDAMRPERIIVLDLGVRTWGGVRLALAGAALSLLRKDWKRYGVSRLFLTAAAELVDIAEAAPDRVIALLESSDLSANPATCLATAVNSAASARTPRDIILLTHPRSLHEPALIAAAESKRSGDRLIAATVDEEGRAELSLWKHGIVPLHRFKVDLGLAENAEVDAPKRTRVAAEGARWTGDIEPIPFAFRPGLVAEPQELAFDAEGEWLVVTARDGVLMGMTFDGGALEVLPRAFKDGTVLKQVSAVLGVTGGVVVCGIMPYKMTGSMKMDIHVAAHYDRTAQRVTLHILCPTQGTATWSVNPPLHCITIKTTTGHGFSLDLTTRCRFPSSIETAMVQRARNAWETAEIGGPPHNLAIVAGAGTDSLKPFSLQLRSNSLHLVSWGTANWEIINPLQEGKPLLENATIYKAQLARSVLAVELARVGERLLVLFKVTSGSVLGLVPQPARPRLVFTLSQDGRLIAYRHASQYLAVCSTAEPAKTLATAPRARLHNALEVRVRAEPFELTVAIGTYAHYFTVFEGRLRHNLTHGWDRSPTPKGALGGCSSVAYDPVRFPATETAGHHPWVARVDRLGQVLLFARGELIATFIIRREFAAAWIPEGVFWGDMLLIGGPQTPDAERLIGKAIEAAGHGS